MTTTATRPVRPARLGRPYDTLHCRTHGCAVETFTRGERSECPACGQPGQEPWQAADLG